MVWTELDGLIRVMQVSTCWCGKPYLGRIAELYTSRIKKLSEVARLLRTCENTVCKWKATYSIANQDFPRCVQHSFGSLFVNIIENDVIKMTKSNSFHMAPTKRRALERWWWKVISCLQLTATNRLRLIVLPSRRCSQSIGIPPVKLLDCLDLG